MSIQPGEPTKRSVEFLDVIRLLAQLIRELKLQRNPELPDVEQQTLLKSLENWHQFRGRTEAELVGWLRRILRNHLADLARIAIQRNQSQQCSLDQGSSPLGICLLSDDSTPSHKAMRIERSSQIHDALNKLPDDQRTAIVLRHMYEFSIEEICPLIGRTAPGVAGLLRRGLTTLRKHLMDDLQRGAHGA